MISGFTCFFWAWAVKDRWCSGVFCCALMSCLFFYWVVDLLGHRVLPEPHPYQRAAPPAHPAPSAPVSDPHAGREAAQWPGEEWVSECVHDSALDPQGERGSEEGARSDQSSPRKDKLYLCCFWGRGVGALLLCICVHFLCVSPLAFHVYMVLVLMS